MGLSAGTTLGQYEIRSLLGAGGMGEVYRARDLTLGREVAIKVLPETLTNDPERLRRFEQEARAAAALSHPNILAVYEFAEYRGIHFLVTELLEGETLRSRLSRGPLPLRKAVDYGVQIANGLAAPHEKQIIHRDLKPENLFITNDGRVKILDFGLARFGSTKPASGLAATVTSEPGAVIGTVGYMSPEQVRGKIADHRSDIFSLGTILYEMVSGIQVFRKPTSAETMSAILNEEPSPVSQFAPAAPPGLQRIVHRCLEKNPEQRFQSSSDLAFALEALSDSNISSGSAIHGGERSRFSHSQLLVMFATLALVAIAGGAAYLLLRPPAVPKLSNYVQLTHDGHSKYILGTDGARIFLYIADNNYRGPAEMAVSGGELRKSPILPSIEMAPIALSPDGSELLAMEGRGAPISGPLWSLPTIGGSPRRLGDLEGQDGSWSPDGRQIAFSKINELFVANKDGSGVRKLATTSRSGFVFSILWSPDMKRLRFASQETLNSNSLYYEVPLDGSSPAQLLDKTDDPNRIECCGLWLGGGKYFVYWDRGQIWTLPPKTWFRPSPRPVQLTSSPVQLSTPFASKDGKKLFVVGRAEQGEASRYDRKTKRFDPFLKGTSAEFIDISRDGQWAAYTSYPEGTIWRSRIDGSERLQLTYSPALAILPRWSPDGRELVFFMAVYGGIPKIYLVSRDGGSPRQLMPDDPKGQQDPNWSPDGSKIIFGGESADPAATIRMFDLKTNQISAVPGSTGLFSPRWSPDGKYLAALTYDSRKIVVYDFEAKKWSEVASGSIGWLNWSNDGKSIYFIGGGGFIGTILGSDSFTGNVLKVNVIDHKVESVVDLNNFSSVGRFGTSLALDRDESPILLRNVGTHDIYSIDVELPVGPNSQIHTYSWP